MAPGDVKRGRGLRIRIGVALVVASWLPIAQIVVWLTSPADADRIRAAIWGVQIVVGLVGVAIAGAETIKVAKSVGWRRSPHVVWRLMRSPDAAIEP